ncbi:MAG: histidinol-phosphatase [Lentisphaeria bacterium]|nr:histidinol-phosphatase [Lentisphaeria bacterium]
MNDGNRLVRVNLHTHTYRCHHATGTVDDYCREAVKAGISILGFAEHTPFPDGEYGASRMAFTELPDYVREVQDARKKYPQMTILLGLEIDYRPILGKAFYQEEFLEKLPLDFLIGGAHFLPAANGCPAHHVSAENPMSLPTLRCFVRESVRLMETGLIEYLAHPDLTARCLPRWTPDIGAAYLDIIEAAAALDMPLEINAYGLRKQWIETEEGTRAQYPWDPFWELVAEHGGIRVVTGSDAHRPEDVWGNLDDTFAIAAKFGLTVRNQEIAEQIIARRKGRLSAAG